MSKAEYLAKEFLKKLASHTTLYKGTIDELEVYEPDDVIWAYKEGYHQAEKDLALTIEDIEKIHTFLYAIKNNKQGVFTFTKLSDEQYQEALNRFEGLKNVK